MKCLFQAALLLVLASFEAGAADLSSFGGLGEAPPQQEKTPFGLADLPMIRKVPNTARSISILSFCWAT